MDATSAHEKHADSMIAAHSSVIDFAKEALRTATLVSGGSAGAMLAFLSGNAGLVSRSNHTILWALAVFAAAVLLAGTGTALSYFAQYRYGEAARAQALAAEPPFVRNTPESEAFNIKGAFWHKFALGCVFACYVCVLIGYGLAVSSMWDGVPSKEEKAPLPRASETGASV